MSTSWSDVAEEARMRCRARRARVLAHPDIAQRLTETPLNYPNPSFWTGYIPPAQIETGRGLEENRSPARRALIDICNAVLVREREIAEGRYQPGQEVPTWVCDSCMHRVTRDQIAVWADGEHVLCDDCDDRARAHASQEIVTPSSPGSATEKQLTRLHILLGEAGITDRDDKLGYCQSVIDRPIDSTKHLSKNEASMVMEAISRVIDPPER